MRDEIETYEQAGVMPLGVNPGSLESHRKYVAKFNFPFPLLVDDEARVADAYGARKPSGGIQRSVVLVGKDGTVKFAERGAPRAEKSLAGLGADGG